MKKEYVLTAKEKGTEAVYTITITDVEDLNSPRTETLFRAAGNLLRLHLLEKGESHVTDT